jgi:hypothetical protein
VVGVVGVGVVGGENRGPPPRPGAPGGMMRSGYGGGAPEVTPLALEPQRQTVRAHVNARFVMSRPVLD